MDEKVDDNIEFVPTSDKLPVINQSAEINLPTSVEIVSKFSEFTVVTSVMPYLLEKVVNEPKEKIYESEVEIHVYEPQNLSQLHRTITQINGSTC